MKLPPEEYLKESRRLHKKIWEKQDIKAMALECIDSLCYAIDDGMNKDRALELIYQFSHCSQESICYDSHENWRKKLIKFFKEEFIDIDKEET